MASFTIPDVDEELEQRLRLRATKHGWSSEEEARYILESTLRPEGLLGAAELLAAIRADAAAYGGIDKLRLPPARPVREPPDFGGAASDNGPEKDQGR